MSGAAGTRAALRSRWDALSARERMGAGLAASAVVVTALWLLAVQPAWRTVQRAPIELTRLDAQWQAMQRDAAEAQRLKAAPVAAATMAVPALQAATQRLGAAATLSLQGDRAVLTLKGADAQAVRQWLGEARSGARARAVEARLALGDKGVDGTLVVALSGASR